MNITLVGQDILSSKILQEQLQSQLFNNYSEASQNDEVTLSAGIAVSKDRRTYDKTGKLFGSDGSIDNNDNKVYPEKKEKMGLDEKADAEKEAQEVQQLKQRDQVVRAHEMAHMAAGGGLVRGGVRYKYEKGPDGKSYAIGGEVSIDTSSEKTPERTLQKMQQVQAAALAPADPSPQDRAVASAAAQKAQEARAEIAKRSITGVSPDKDKYADTKKTEHYYGKLPNCVASKSKFNIVI